MEITKQHKPVLINKKNKNKFTNFLGINVKRTTYFSRSSDA